MDQVDHILVDQLREIGCDIDDNAESIKDLTKDRIMECVSTCLHYIDPNNTDLRKSDQGNLNIASKFRLASNLARTCNSIGYKSKLEYQTFLYGNITEIRNLFLFLIERAFREDAVQLKYYEETVNDRDRLPTLQHRFKFNDHFKVHYPNQLTDYNEDLLFKAHEIIIRHLWIVRPIDLVSTEKTDQTSNIEKALIPLSKRPPVAPRKQNVTVDIGKLGLGHIVSLCEWNQHNTQKDQSENSFIFDLSEFSFNRYIKQSIDYNHSISSFQNEERIEIQNSCQQQQLAIDTDSESGRFHDIQDDSHPDDDGDDLKLNMNIVINNKKSLLEQLTTELNSLNMKHRVLLNDEKLLYNLEDKIKQSKKHHNELRLTTKTTQDLLHDISLMDDDLSKYRSNWTEVESFLTKEISQLELEVSMDSTNDKVLLRMKIKDASDKLMSNKIKIKRNFIAIENLSTKVASFKEQKHDLSRSSYVKMLNEVMRQLKKQKDDLNKVILEVRALQKEINSLSGRLQRSFTLVDEALFGDAKSDEWNIKCYRLLATMHEECGLLIQGVEYNAEVVRDILKLEEMVNMEKFKNIDKNLSLVSHDLQVIRDDNKTCSDITTNNF